MVTVHRELLSRLRAWPPAIALATPYAFQENAPDVSTRTQRYFADSVGLQVRVAAGTSPNADPGMAPPLIPPDEEDDARQAAAIRAADWVFAGPGARHTRSRTGKPGRSRAGSGPGAGGRRADRAGLGGRRHRGRFTLPVYEIYKAGGAPRWLDGSTCSARSAHRRAHPPLRQRQGRRYDTGAVYLAKRGWPSWSATFPLDAAVLGVDQHAAVLIDLRQRHSSPRPGRRDGPASGVASCPRVPAVDGGCATWSRASRRRRTAAAARCRDKDTPGAAAAAAGAGDAGAAAPAAGGGGGGGRLVMAAADIQDTNAMVRVKSWTRDSDQAMRKLSAGPGPGRPARACCAGLIGHFDQRRRTGRRPQAATATLEEPLLEDCGLVRRHGRFRRPTPSGAR